VGASHEVSRFFDFAALPEEFAYTIWTVLKEQAVDKDVVEVLRRRRLSYFGHVSAWTVTDIRMFYCMAMFMAFMTCVTYCIFAATRHMMHVMMRSS